MLSNRFAISIKSNFSLPQARAHRYQSIDEMLKNSLGVFRLAIRGESDQFVLTGIDLEAGCNN